MQVVAIYLPQNLLLILAAFFAICLLGAIFYCKSWAAASILLGLCVGAALFYGNAARNFAKVEPYLGETVYLTARVEDPYDSYIVDMVGATLQVESVNGAAVSFACTVSLLPTAEHGEIIAGQFYITGLTTESDMLSNYSNGVFAQAEYLGDFTSAGYITGLRAFFIAAQEKLSRIIRISFSDEVGGVLAAMTVGDRDYVIDAISDNYRKAGLSHVLVVSGLHLSLLCGFVMVRENTRRARVIKNVLTICLAFLLAGITGATASILRAAFVLVIYTIGSLCNEQADSFTSLGLAGFILICTNGYLVCNLSFQLSMFATLGVLLGAAFAKQTLPHLRKWGLWHAWVEVLYLSLVITLFATAATFPVLVLWDMNISLLAFVSNVLTFWMIPFILLLGFAGALLGLVPFLGVCSTLCLTGAAIFVAVLNKMVTNIARLPGAQLYFETEYAVYVCLALFVLGGFAHALNIRYRVAVPALVIVLVAGLFIGNYYSYDLIKITMVGTSSSPAIVITQNQEAMVLFRGGEYNTQAVASYLEKRNITDIQLVVDLRSNPSSEYTLDTAQNVWLFEVQEGAEYDFQFGDVQGTLFHTDGSGVVVLTIGETTLATTSGAFRFAQAYLVDFLLATSSNSGDIVGEIALCKGSAYALKNGYTEENIYYGGGEVAVWLRANGAYQLRGGTNGE